MKLVIDRSRWLRGEGNTKSRLLRSDDGKMCCLGFFAVALGYKPEEIRDKSEPDCTVDQTVADPRSLWPDWAVEVKPDKFFLESEGDPDCDPDPFVCQKNIIGSLMGYNDESDLDEESREYHVRSIFERHGVEVEFIGPALGETGGER